MRRALAVGGFLLALGVTSCAGGPAEPNEDRVRVVGTLGSVVAPDQVGIVVPDQVGIRELLSVRVTTTGDTCTEIAGTEVTVQGRLMRIVPYDEVPEPNSGVNCGAILKLVRHAAAAIFDSPGEVTVRVVGSFYQGTSEGLKQRLDSLDYTVMIGP